MLRLAIVDDERTSLDFIASMIDFEELGIELVLKTTSPMEALSAVRNGGVDILLMDVMMPQIDGVTLSGLVAEADADVKILALSSYDDYDYVRSILKNGAWDYILKHRVDRKLINTTLSHLAEEVTKQREGLALSAGDRQALTDAIAAGDRQALVSVLDNAFASSSSPKDLAASCFSLLMTLKNAKWYEDLVILAQEEAMALIEHGLVKDFITNFADLVDSCAITQYYRSDLSTTVQGALCLMEQSYALNLSLGDVAEVLSVSPSYLSRVFSKETGSTFIETLNQIKVVEARRLIREGKTLKEVSYECGFKNYSYFLKVFKQVCGTSPGDYQSAWAKVKIFHH